MSKFLDNLKSSANHCLMYAYDEDGCCTHNRYQVAEFLAEINLLGENARRMLEIGILQDNLIELEFKPTYASSMAYLGNKKLHIKVYISLPDNEIRMYQEKLVSFYSLDEASKVMTKVKELINEN